MAYGNVALTVIGGIPGREIGVVTGIPGIFGCPIPVVVRVVAMLATEGITPLAVATGSAPLFDGSGNKWLVECGILYSVPNEGSQAGTVGVPPTVAGCGC